MASFKKEPICLKVFVEWNTKVVNFKKGSFRIISLMVLLESFKKQGTFILECTKTTSKRDMESTFSQMAKLKKECSKMEICLKNDLI